MSLTVRELIALRDLALAPVTTTGDLECQVSWVAISELLDPSPWLEGGEFLLTTGMRLSADPASCAEYIEHLVSAGVSALGFGVGLSHLEVPAALIAAAEARGVTVIVVPEPMPFVAITRAVSQWLSAKEYEQSAQAFATQRELIRAALSSTSDTAALVGVLGRHVGGFAMHLDARGAALAAFPQESARRAEEFRDDVDRLRPRGLLASSAISTADEHVVLVPLGVRGAASGFLVVGTAQPLPPTDQAVLNLAVSLLSWSKSRPLANSGELSALRSFLISRAESESIPMSTWSALGIADKTVQIVRLRMADSATAADLESVLVELSGDTGALWVQCEGLGIVGIVPVGRTDTLLNLGQPIRACGVSAPFELGDHMRFRSAMDQAERAHMSGTGVVYFERLAGRGFSSLVDAGAASTWAAEYVGAIAASSEATELLATVRAWLGHHGQVDAAATDLGVHRHTVRHRLRRAETLLERSFDDPAVRADLWFALCSLDEGIVPVG